MGQQAVCSLKYAVSYMQYTVCSQQREAYSVQCIFLRVENVLANRADHHNYYLLVRNVSLLIGPDTTFPRMGSDLAYRAGLIGLDTISIRKGSIFANRAGNYIY